MKRRRMYGSYPDHAGTKTGKVPLFGGWDFVFSKGIDGGLHVDRSRIDAFRVDHRPRSARSSSRPVPVFTTAGQQRLGLAGLMTNPAGMAGKRELNHQGFSQSPHLVPTKTSWCHKTTAASASNPHQGRQTVLDEHAPCCLFVWSGGGGWGREQTAVAPW